MAEPGSASVDPVRPTAAAFGGDVLDLGVEHPLRDVDQDQVGEGHRGYDKQQHPGWLNEPEKVGGRREGNQDSHDDDRE